MPINYTKTQEGDVLNAASLNDRFDEIAGTGPDRGVNNLAQEDLERFALRRDHLPSIIPTPSAAHFPSGMCKVGPADSSAGTIDTYSSFLNAGVIGLPVAWETTFGGLGANPPYGPPGAADVGWRIPATGGVIANAAEIEVGIARVGTNIGNYQGILVRTSIALHGCGQPVGTGPLTYTYNLPSVVIGIGWEDDLGNRKVLDRSVRWSQVCSRIKGSLDTFTLITAQDIPVGRTLSKVFAVICGANKAAAWTDAPSPIIDFYNIEAIPLRFGDM